jgi:hypothetical protein
MLIKDLDQETQHPERETDQQLADDDEQLQLDTDEAPHRGWDQEHNEESHATRWSNDPAGFRVEEVKLDGDPDALSEDTPVEDELLLDKQPLDQFDDDLNDAPELESRNEALDMDGPLAEPVKEETEDSIEAYMNRLLRRVQGQPLEETPPPAAVSAVKSSAKQPIADTETAKPVKERFDPSKPLIPRSQAPEKSSSLSAMRELANASARIAISRSVRVQTRDTQIKGMVSLTCAIGAILCGIACYFFIPGIMRYLAVAMTIVVASIYLREGWQLFRDANRCLKAAAQGKIEQDIRDEADKAEVPTTE